MIPSLENLKIPADVKNDITSAVEILLEKFRSGIRKIILFGSYANGKYQPDSDIDIAVMLTEMPDKNQRRLYKQAVDLDNRDVDLLFCLSEQLSGNEYVFKHINEQGVVLYE
jgi:predicted nucleotidyltransferase